MECKITLLSSRDGKGQELASCVAGFRNRPHAAQVRMRYYQQVLTLEMNPGITTRASDFEECFRVENVKLSPGGYFGVSAATGALADDHDIFKFLTYSLFERVEQVRVPRCGCVPCCVPRCGCVSRSRWWLVERV